MAVKNINDAQREELSPWVERVDVDGTTTYVGWALPGTLTSSPTWRIYKFVESGNDVVMTWADSNDKFDNVWDDRAGLTYG